MSAVTELFGSSAALVLLCMGVSAMIGVLHLWMSTRVGDANWWVAVWSVLACIFLGARGLQLTTSDAAAALLAGKVSFAIGPYLVWALVAFGRNLNGGRLEPRVGRTLGAISVCWTLAILLTPWFVESEVTTRLDFFGREHLSVRARWPALVLGGYFLGALAWGIRRLRTHSQLEPSERRALLSAFALYAGLGVAAILTSAGMLEVPAMAEFGPLVVAIALCHLMVRRRGRVERQLAMLLEEKRSRLEESEERYSELLHNAPIGIVVCDAAGRISTLNPRMQELVANAIGPDALGREGAPTGLRALGLEAVPARVLARGGVDRFDHGLRVPPEAEERTWQVTASRVVTPEGGPGVLLLVDDVTERNRLERQLQQSQKMDSVGQLAAGVAHEINNPMAYVRANLREMSTLLEELRVADTDADPRKSLLCELETLIEESLEGVERTISIVRDMRDLAHSGSAGGEEGTAGADLAAVLDACVRMASVYDTGSARIELRSIEPVQVAISAGPLRQVVLNLLMNALQAIGDRGGIWIEAESCDERVRVSIQDDGPGIPESVRSRLFDPFFTTKPVGEGTGLGLYISYQIAKSFGGDIEVGDAARGGARFDLLLPRAAALPHERPGIIVEHA